MLQAEGSVDQKIVAILFPAVGYLSVNRFGKESFIPIDFFGKLLDLGGRHARSVHRPDDTAHAGPGDPVHGDVIFFHPLDDADFGQG
jgi:hypothetical protein